MSHSIPCEPWPTLRSIPLNEDQLLARLPHYVPWKQIQSLVLLAESHPEAARFWASDPASRGDIVWDNVSPHYHINAHGLTLASISF